MDNLQFDWDKGKAVLNKKKHGVSFEEAMTTFYDDDALEFHDPDHSHDEDRFILMGFSFRSRVVVVSHCIRESGDLVRIISARRALKHEAQKYWEEKP
jgi:uncharacterized DUF497 family protein